MSVTAYGYVREGKLFLDDKLSYVQGLARMKPGPVRVHIEPTHEVRSLQQNRYWHGVIVKLFGEHCGYEADEMHEVLKAELLAETKLLCDPTTGEVLREVKTPRSTATLTTVEFNDLIERAHRLGAELGLVIPDPDPAWSAGEQ